MPGPVSTIWRPTGRVDVRRTLSPLRRGAGDPTMRVDHTGVWKTCCTPAGPATVHLADTDADGITATAWGPGGEWVIAAVPDLLGRDDDWSELDCSAHPLLDRTRRAVPGLRIPRTNLVFESLVPAVLEQRVVGADARQSWRRLLHRYGTAAPGPAPDGMLVCPTATEWGRIPSWEWHLANVDPGRARAVTGAARVADGLERTLQWGRGGPRVASALQTVPGVGVWTAAEIVQRAHGDPDTVSVGDFHLARLVGWALIGKPVDDDGMLEILEQWRGHRYRIVRLIESSGFDKPRFAHRAARVDHRRH